MVFLSGSFPFSPAGQGRKKRPILRAWDRNRTAALQSGGQIDGKAAAAPGGRAAEARKRFAPPQDKRTVGRAAVWSRGGRWDKG